MSIKEEIIDKVLILENLENNQKEKDKNLLKNNDLKKLYRKFKRRRNSKLVYLFLLYISIILIIMILPILLTMLINA